jgi:hypothetical protein
MPDEVQPNHSVENKHWAIRASEQEGAPGQTNPEPSRSMGHSANNAPSRMQQVRDRLAPYGSRLISDVKSVPSRTVEAAKDKVRQAPETARKAVKYSDERLGSSMMDFTAGFSHPIKQVQQQRQIRRKQQVFSELNTAHQASPFTPVPKAKKPKAPKRMKTYAELELDGWFGHAKKRMGGGGFLL